jgi:hypothetical protein
VTAHVGLPLAWALIVGVLVGATWYAGRRLQVFVLAGDD